MINTLSDYFLAEKQESLIFLAVGLLRPKAVGQYRQIGCPTYGIPWRPIGETSAVEGYAAAPSRSHQMMQGESERKTRPIER